MEDDVSVRKLVEIIFSKKCNISGTTTAADPITSYLLANDFAQRFQVVLLMKYMIFNNEWRREIRSCLNIMLLSEENYLEIVIFACLTEYKCYQNVFEGFINVCAFLKLFNDEILVVTGMDSTELNTDVFMVVYDNVMKSAFYKQGGLQKLVKYIHGHRYLSWKWKLNDIVSTDKETRNKTENDIKNKREKEYSERYFPRTETDLIKMGETCSNLVQKVLSFKSVKLHTLQNNPNMIKYLPEASRNEEKIIKATSVFVDLDIANQRGSSLNSNTNTEYTVDQTSTSENEETAKVGDKERSLEAAAEFLGLDEASKECSSSNSDLKTDYSINRTPTSKNGEIEESEKEIMFEATVEFVDLDEATNGCSRSISESKTDHTINHTSTSKNEKMAEESEKERISEAESVNLEVTNQECLVPRPDPKTDHSKNEKMAEESKKERISEAESVDLDVTNQECSISSTVPKTDHSSNHTSMSKNEKMAEESAKERIIDATAVFTDLDATSLVCSSSNNNLKANPRINHNMDNFQFENIIQAVIRQNRTRSPGHTNLVDLIQKEADGILDHLKNTIKSLTTVLDDFGKV